MIIKFWNEIKWCNINVFINENGECFFIKFDIVCFIGIINVVGCIYKIVSVFIGEFFFI